MRLDDVLERLEGVRRSGSGYSARCPAHEDQHASLSVNEDEGKVLLHCHAGCEYRDVLAALGIERLDGEPEPEIVYTYLDETRTPVYDVVRRPGKEFWQRRYTETGKVWGMEGVRRTLYRLPDILEAQDKTRWVFVVEGEKDVDAIWRAGGIATCNTGGAGSWEPHLSEYLRDRNVTIVRDKDDAGAKHAAEVRLSLQGIAQRIRVVEARGGKDTSDHLQAGYTLEDFVPAARRFTPIDFSVPIPEADWLWDKWVAVGDTVLLSGVPKLGKSWLTMGLAVSMANGDGWFLGRAVRPGRVLYFDEENPRDVVWSRVARKLGLQNMDDLMYISQGGLRLDRHPEYLLEEALDFGPSLIVIDSLARVHAKEENSFADMAEILNGTLRPLALQTNASVILIHHHDKQARGPRGSGDIEAAVDTSIEVRGEPGQGSFYLRMRGGRRGKSAEPISVQILDVPGAGTRLQVGG